jgi:succinoglycan biosynthesis transport protein ExoP
MDIHDYLGVLRRGWALIVLGLLVGLAGGSFAQQLEVPSYSATARDLVTSQSSGVTDVNDTVQANGLAAGRVASFVLVASSGLVLQPVIDELRLDMTVDQLASQISVVSPPNTVVIETTATAESPALAQSIANAISATFSRVVAEQLEPEPVVVETPLPVVDANGTPIPDPVVTVLRIVNIEEAELPTEPEQAVGPFFLVIGAIAGLGLGLVAASVREALDRRVRTRRDVAAVTEAPVVGVLRRDRALRRTPLAGGDRGNGSVSESFRSLRTAIGHLRVRDRRSAFVVTAMARGNGATTVTANLAVAIAKTATTVVVVDANIASPELTAVLDARGSRGLTDVLAGRVGLDEALRPGPHGTTVLSVGRHPGATAELLATAAMRDLLETLRERFDVVLVDAPALSVGTEATVLGSFGCATLLVVPAGAVIRPRLAETLATLAMGGQTPAGIILNRPPRRLPGRRVALPVAKGAAPAQPRPAKPARAPKPVKAERVPARAKNVAAPAVPPPVLFQPPSVYAPVAAPAPTAAISSDPVTTGPITKIPFRIDGAEPSASPEPISEVPKLGAATPATPRTLPKGNVTPLSAAVSRERKARESYLQRSRDLERAAAERLAQEQALLAQRVREELDRERRQLSDELDNQLEDTVLMGRSLADG